MRQWRAYVFENARAFGIFASGWLPGRRTFTTWDQFFAGWSVLSRGGRPIVMLPCFVFGFVCVGSFVAQYHSVAPVLGATASGAL